MARLTKEEQKRREELLAKGLKVCNKCGRELPVEQFSKCERNKDGLQNKCKECNRQYHEEHKEEKQQYQRQYNQENKEKIQQYRQEHKEEIQQYQQQYDKQYYQEHKQENKEKRQQYYKQYKQTPQGQVAYFNAYAKRRKHEEAQGNGITKEQWLEMMQFFDFKCAYSGVLVNTKNNRSIDHIIPLAKGGEHEVWNCVPMDKSLNTSKRDKDMLEWYTVQDFYDEERLDKINEWQQYAYNKWSNQEQNIKIKEI